MANAVARRLRKRPTVGETLLWKELGICVVEGDMSAYARRGAADRRGQERAPAADLPRAAGWEAAPHSGGSDPHQPGSALV
jgi:hypothetical protein